MSFLTHDPLCRPKSLFLALLLGIFVFGSGCESSGNGNDKASNGNVKEKSSKSNRRSEKDKARGETPSEDLYAGMSFSSLNGAQRTLFVDVAKGELCPCDGSNQSLHGCLQKSETQCTAAKRIGAMVATSVRQGLEKKDIQAKVAKLNKQLTTTYEFSLDSAPRQGSEDAPVRIVEFADFQCPHCKRASAALKEIRAKFGKDVVHYFKHFPLNTHPQADLAARASIAAHNQDQFWAMHDLLFEHQRSLSRQKILSFARQLGLKISEFKSDLKAPSTMAVIRANKQKANEIDIQGTPAIFINGRRHVGPNSVEALSQAIRAALDQSSNEKASSENEPGQGRGD